MRHPELIGRTRHVPNDFTLVDYGVVMSGIPPELHLLRAHNEEEYVTSGARVPGGIESLCLNLE